MYSQTHKFVVMLEKPQKHNQKPTEMSATIKQMMWRGAGNQSRELRYLSPRVLQGSFRPVNVHNRAHSFKG